MMKRLRYAASPALLLMAGCSGPAEIEERLLSPDGRIEIGIGPVDQGVIAFRVAHDGNEVISRSPIGLTLGPGGTDDAGDATPLRDVAILSVTRSTGEERYHVPGGASQGVVRSYGSLIVHGQERQAPRRKIDVELRAYDGGAAFRLVVPQQPGIETVRVASEATSFAFPDNYACLAVHQSELSNNHEGEYAAVKARDLKADGYYDLPLVCQTGRDGETVGITESGIENYAAAYLVAGTASQPGVSIKLTPHPDNPALAVETPMTKDGVASPWRVMMIADRPEALVGSTMVDDLAAPSRIADMSWIAPGKAAWGWWSGLLAPGVSNPGTNQATYKYYIDFAGRFGLPYYLIDRGWAWRGAPGAEEDAIADITRATDGVNMAELIRYARQRGVRIWLWVNWEALDGRMDEALALYERMGVAGIKVDYLYRQDQRMVAFYHRLLSTAAKHRLMVNIHASFVARGLSRTYPNYMTQEGVMGSEYNRWSRRDTARGHVALAYTRATVGPMDYAPGGFRNVTPAQFKPRNDAPMMMTTRAHQLALFVAFPSPLTVLADAPIAYETAQGTPAPGADFLKLVPTSWDETRGIAGEFGRYIAVARRKGNQWFVGILNDDQARDIAIPLAFLSQGKWQVTSWADGGSPELVTKRHGQLRADAKTMVIRAGANGGTVLLFSIKNDNTK